MIDSKKIQAVMETLQATKDAEARNARWYSDILSILEAILDNIDGHPGRAVEQIEELHEKLDEAFSNANMQSASTKEEVWKPKWWQVGLFVLGVGILASLFAAAGVALMVKLGYILVVTV